MPTRGAGPAPVQPSEPGHTSWWARTTDAKGGRVDATRDPRFVALVHARTAALLRSAYLLTGDRQLAEDLVQTALAKTALHWRRVDKDRAEAYTRKVMYHEQVTQWRRRRVAESFPATMPESTGRGSESDATELKVAVARALTRLGPRQRAVLVLRYYEDLPITEVAKLLGCSVGTIKSQTHRALATLRAAAPQLLDFSDNRNGASRS